MSEISSIPEYCSNLCGPYGLDYIVEIKYSKKRSFDDLTNTNAKKACIDKLDSNVNTKKRKWYEC